MDNRETLTPSSGDAILKRHLFSEVARNLIKGRGHIERAYFVRRPSRQSFGFRVAASSGPIPKAPGSAGGYLLHEFRSGVVLDDLGAFDRCPATLRVGGVQISGPRSARTGGPHSHAKSSVFSEEKPHFGGRKLQDDHRHKADITVALMSVAEGTVRRWH